MGELRMIETLYLLAMLEGKFVVIAPITLGLVYCLTQIHGEDKTKQIVECATLFYAGTVFLSGHHWTFCILSIMGFLCSNYICISVSNSEYWFLRELSILYGVLVYDLFFLAPVIRHIGDYVSLHWFPIALQVIFLAYFSLFKNDLYKRNSYSKKVSMIRQAIIKSDISGAEFIGPFFAYQNRFVFLPTARIIHVYSWRKKTKGLKIEAWPFDLYIWEKR